MKISFYILFITFFFINIVSANENDYYLILKNNKVNVRYGPGFNYQIKYIYKKKNLPIKVIDKKENFRRIIDLKKNIDYWAKFKLIYFNIKFIRFKF